MLGNAVSRKGNFIQEALPGIPARSVSSGNVYIPPVRLPKTPKRPPVEQLAMYKTPTEVMDEYDPLKGDKRAGETTRMTWERKAEEGRKGFAGNSRMEAFSEESPDTLANSIKREGVQNPVTLQTKDLSIFETRPQVFGGHHRVATASKIDPNMLIPVTYAESFSGASTNARRQGDDPRFPVAAKTTTEPETSETTSSSNK
jgi:hypothetical protein